MQAKVQAAEVLKLLKDPDKDVRIAAVTALGAMQAKDQATEVLKLLKDTDANISSAAASALGHVYAKDDKYVHRMRANDRHRAPVSRRPSLQRRMDFGQQYAFGHGRILQIAHRNEQSSMQLPMRRIFRL